MPHGPPGGPLGGPGAYVASAPDPRAREAHKLDVPALGSSTSVMPSVKEYVVWKEKVAIYLELTGYTQVFTLGRLLMKMSGRVAEYALLTFSGEQRRREDALAELCSRLDSVM